MPRRLRGEPARLAQRVLAGRRVDLARRRRVGHRGAVAERPDAAAGRRRAASRRPRTRPRSSTGRPSCADERVGGHAGRPDDGRRPRSGGRRRARRRRRRPTRARSPVTISMPRRPSVRAAKRARPSGVWPRIRCARSTSTQRGSTPASRGWRRSAPATSSWSSAIASTPAKPAPANTNVSRRAARVGRGVGELDLAQHVVAQADRVAEVLEAERVLAQARHGRHARHRAERDHELARRRPRTRPASDSTATTAALGVERDGRAEQRGRRAGTSCAAAPSRGAARCCPPPPRAAAACRA